MSVEDQILIGPYKIGSSMSTIYVPTLLET